MTEKELSYNDALNEIEDILYEVEKNEIQPDHLSEKVKRVSYLLEFCKKKLLNTEKQIEEIFDNKDQ